MIYMSFVNHPTLETFDMEHNLPPGEFETLQSFNLPMTRRAVSLAEIDWDNSTKNLARDFPINEQHLEDLIVACKAGAIFPDVVLCQHGKKFVIWSGNHRCGAVREAGISKVIMAVVVSCDDEAMSAIVPGVLNTTSGMPLTRKEKTARAAAAIKQWNWSLTNAAKTFGLSETTLSRTIIANDLRTRIEKMGVNTTELSESHLTAMNPVAGNDHVLEEVARIAVSAKTTSGDVRDVVKQIKKERSESAMLDRAKSVRAELIGVTHRSNGHAPRRSKAIEFKMALTRLLRLVKEVSSVRQFGITQAEEIEKAESECRNLASELRRVADRKARGKAGSKKAG